MYEDERNEVIEILVSNGVDVHSLSDESGILKGDGESSSFMEGEFLRLFQMNRFNYCLTLACFIN